MTLRIFLFLISFSQAQAAFSERGMLPMDHQWWECSMGGPAIECKVEECVAKCEEILKAQKAEKEAEREEKIQDIIIDSQQQDDSQKNPALFQVQ
ncbi:MAG: hypothetical protein ACHQYQ_08120 [Bacteriovoracales bacterium]